MVGKDHTWPIDDVWNYHAGGGEFKTIGVFSDALANRYGKSDNVEDFAIKSQMQTYEGVRAMYEAYSRNKYQSAGVIQWMLNNAWPSMIWHLYDYYLRPGGGYFGAKRAMEALHPLYGYDDHSIWVVSSQYTDVKGLKLITKIYNLDMTEKFTQENPVDAAADSTAKVFTLPDVSGLSNTYFLALRLEDMNGKQVGSNFYWLSTKPEVIDWGKEHVVDDSNCIVRRLHRHLATPQGQGESYGSNRAQRRGIDYARHDRESEQEAWRSSCG